ncbi:hypothetical protein STCU_03743 [Strigomonas culicis]|uniref:PRORP domain-containing protein n=1 Tax=Strigomonas culicis TaxID=28005 RepID=S9W4Y9_9TRYP|nr:hypothetical protein STCU_03743 [Strigomonas culicis]|eukprot:EPY30960.1 hypothetical protein STCU_03743 [Strigomonas culicis]
MSDADGEGPPRWKKKVELNAAIDVGLSSVAAVRELVEKNNAQTKLKKRLKVTEFISETLMELAKGAARSKNTDDTFRFLNEMVLVKKLYTPRSAILSKILYAWKEKDLVNAAARLVRQTVEYKSLLGDDMSTFFDESYVTVSLRVLTAASPVDTALIQKMLSYLPASAYKRRLFNPLFKYALSCNDVDFAFTFFRVACQNKVELWDEEYHLLLQLLVRVKADAARVTPYVVQLLEEMALHHPVTGRGNVRLLGELLGGTNAQVDSGGMCGACGQAIQSFDLSGDDRGVLLDDIVEKLVKPRVSGRSNYEPELEVGEAEKEKRWGSFEHFKNTLSALRYDAVVDGANVGYYGLNNWYSEAKAALLRAQGVDVATVPLHKRTHVPFPVDVPPKFRIVDSLVKTLVAQGRRPLVVFHQRHIANASDDNLVCLQQWLEQNIIVGSPAFLNDDYCWLYACLARPGSYIVTNDQMRDHHFSMLSRRFFLRWRQRHRITYKALFQKSTSVALLHVRPPRAYSVWTQRAPDSVATHWHIPFLDSVDVLDQATNRVYASDKDVDLSKGWRRRVLRLVLYRTY